MHLLLLPPDLIALLAHQGTEAAMLLDFMLAACVAFYVFTLIAFRIAGSRAVPFSDLLLAMAGAAAVGAGHGLVIYPMLLLVSGFDFSWTGYTVFSLLVAMLMIVLQALERREGQGVSGWRSVAKGRR